ncbi:hypothetical protein [Emticicia sp.]|uniref:hypothetical protein n=1 Tax=Emticicia sp. TaxID=1930953 RepID=UPI003751C859
MKNLNIIEQEIDKTLASLKGIERATINPFFYTRLEANMQQRNAPLPRFVFRPAFIWSLLALIVVLNVSVAIRYSKKDKASEEQNASAFAQEYGLSLNGTNL